MQNEGDIDVHPPENKPEATVKAEPSIKLEESDLFKDDGESPQPVPETSDQSDPDVKAEYPLADRDQVKEEFADDELERKDVLLWTDGGGGSGAVKENSFRNGGNDGGKSLRQKNGSNRNGRIERYLDNLCRDAEVSPLALSLCSFKCRQCEFTSGGWDYFQRHCSKHNHGPAKSKFIGKYLVKTVAHPCFVCGRKVLSDSCFIKEHVRRHELSMNAYLSTYACGGQARENEQAAALAAKGELSDAVGNLCEFACRTCGERFASLERMQRHASKSKHDAAERGKTADITASIAKVVAHRCRLCERRVLCDGRFLKRHFLQEHEQMSINEYVSRTGVEIRLPPRSRSAFGGVAGDGRGVRRTAAPDEPRFSLLVDDLCLFACPDCAFRTNSWRSLAAHRAAAAHGRGRPDADCHEYVVWHKCLVCGKTLLCDTFALREHVRLRHQLTLKQYTVAAKLRKDKSKGTQVRSGGSQQTQ